MNRETYLSIIINNKTITQLTKVDKCNNYGYYSNMSTYLSCNV